ncbi:ferredoxin reductase [Actinokineospora sp. UTMC 2448]|uniref:ferredoxin reductase n=1 Tax=Actinokineospora sp. UTMC 2448 TaxID=2268449 RepID=UPI00216474E0|nr:ferredoxin reductase [Actinokineospora sp. UTMC 2448]
MANSGLVRTAVRRVLESPIVTGLTAPHGVDRYLGMVNPLWSVREIRAVVVRVAHHTPDTVTLTLRPNANWTGARAGQHVRLTVAVGGVLRTRFFSVASAEGSADVEITAKVNRAVSRHLKEHARPGMVVTLSPAEGEFVLPDVLPARLLLISGGSGITPVMSILRTLTARAHDSRITFLHYAFTPRDVVYADELAAIAAADSRVTLRIAYTEAPGAGALDGLFRREHLAGADHAAALTYVCGPAPLMDAVADLWAADGLADRLLAERFVPVTVPSADAVGEVRFRRSGVRAANDGRSLLEQAEAAGLSPEYGCRMGVCHTCTTVKAGGAVRNTLTGAVSAEPGERVQLCVTTACGDVELDI